MHACGHDIHMSTFIGTARALGKLKGQMARHDHFYRPAGGGNRRRRAGVVEGRALHALAETGFRARSVARQRGDRRPGKIGVTEGYAFANVDSVDVTVHGIGGHGAYPHKTKDPIVFSRPKSSTPGKRSQSRKITRSIRSWSRSARFTAGRSTTSFPTK